MGKNQPRDVGIKTVCLVGLLSDKSCCLDLLEANDY